MKLIALSVAWVFGIYIGSLVSLPLYGFLTALILPLLVALLYRKRMALLWAALCLVTLFGGIACYEWRVSEPTLQSFNGYGVVEMRGEVYRDPESAGGVARLSLKAQEIEAGGSWEGVSGKVLIDTTLFPSYSLGDLVEITGELHAISEVTESSYRDYLMRQGFSSTMSYPQIEFRQRGWLLGVRNRLSESLSYALPEPQGALAEALLLGIRSHVPDALREDFRNSGTSHILAISGMNIAILAGVVLASSAWLLGRHRPTYLIVTFVTLWLYVPLTGMGAPILRSAIMFSLFLVALWLGRPRSGLVAVALAAVVMVGIDPSSLWDVSFQLSFASMAGLIGIFPILQGWGRKITTARGGKSASAATLAIDGMAVTVAATLATLPLIIYYFGYVSVMSVPATFFALLVLPVAIVLAMLVAVLGLFAPPLSLAVGWVDWLFLSVMIGVVEGFGSLSFASHQMGPINGIVAWLYYGVLVVVLSGKRFVAAVCRPLARARGQLGKLPRIVYRFSHKGVVISLLVAAALIWLAVMAAPDRQLEVSFIDVGEGDAILIQTPSGQQILVDGGPDPETTCLVLGKRLPFWGKSLDLVVLTHPEDDHIVGLVEVLCRYKVDQVLDPCYEQGTSSYQEWLRLIGQNNINRTTARAGQRIDLGDGVMMEVLHPQAELLKGSDSDANNNSVVLRLEWKEISFLLTGDIGEEAEQEIMHNGGKLNSTVLKVAHHGSATSSSSRFLTAVGAQVAVISVGGKNPFGHPAGETLARLGDMDVYRTDEQGTLTFITDGERLWVDMGG